jgi:hypothetical protein
MRKVTDWMECLKWNSLQCNFSTYPCTYMKIKFGEHRQKAINFQTGQNFF